MYIPGFWVGVVATILVEVIVVVGAVIYVDYKEDKKDKELWKK